ncbi:hypothetical protein [Nostoc sp.]|uniref:hypothetical protein n=1 Tax=Nostoc sp. TaxID=1180 RepID=UPI002FF82508
MHRLTWAIASLNYLTAIKLLPRQGLPLSAAALLRDAGIDIRPLAKVPNTPPPTPPRSSGGETKRSFGGVGFLFLIYSRIQVFEPHLL